MQRQVPNFIQEQGSCVGHFETANSLRDRSGESALLVPKQFAFQQVKGNGCAIQLYERTSDACTAIVNGTGDQLLTRTRFPKDQGGGIGRCYPFHLREYELQSRAVAYDLFKQTFSLTLFT